MVATQEAFLQVLKGETVVPPGPALADFATLKTRCEANHQVFLALGRGLDLTGRELEFTGYKSDVMFVHVSRCVLFEISGKEVNLKCFLNPSLGQWILSDKRDGEELEHCGYLPRFCFIESADMITLAWMVSRFAGQGTEVEET